jgi:DNA repair exonuclease SbcCD ATPase subunit
MPIPIEAAPQSPIAAMVQRHGAVATPQDLAGLDERLRKWVLDHIQSQNAQTSALFHRTQEAGRALEDKIANAHGQIAVNLRQTHEATRHLAELVAESSELRTKLQSEVHDITEYFEEKLSAGGEAIMAKDLALRRRVDVHSATMDDLVARLDSLTSDLPVRVASLEVQIGKQANAFESVCQVLDSSYKELEQRMEFRLDAAERGSGSQQLFGAFSETSQKHESRMAAIESRLQACEERSAQMLPVPSEGNFELDLAELQAEVDTLSTEVIKLSRSPPPCRWMCGGGLQLCVRSLP